MVGDRRPRLILLNGPPGIGKSTLARRYVGDRPLSFCLDVDGFRRLIGDWERHEERSGLLAREMAIAMVRTHVGAGHDVVMPQYVARADFIERLAATAAAEHASFHEVFLTDGRAAALARFDARRSDPAWVQHHAEAVRAMGGLAGFGEMFDRLETFRASRPHALTVETRVGHEDAAYVNLTAVLDAGAR
jgi:predicted kinase